MSEKIASFIVMMIFFLLALTIVGEPWKEWFKRRREERLEAATPPEAVCQGCDHHYSFHDPTGYACKDVITRKQYNDNGKRITDRLDACSCTMYVGPIPDQIAHFERLMHLDLPSQLKETSPNEIPER